MTKYGKALIVDDARFMREMIRDVIAPLFADVHEASSRKEALQVMGAHKPELITLDLSLDCNDPIEGLAFLKDVGSEVPNIVVISALDQEWLRDEVHLHGAAAYVPKPFDKKELKQVIKQLMEAQ